VELSVRKKSYKTNIANLAVDFAVVQLLLSKKYIDEYMSDNRFLVMEEARAITIFFSEEPLHDIGLYWTAFRSKSRKITATLIQGNRRNKVTCKCSHTNA
jgi:hypothetical protein